MLLQEIFEANRKFCAAYIPQKMAPHPSRKLAVIACMDCRISGVLEAAMGLRPGEAIFLKNAGNRVMQDGGDIIRSLTVAIYELGVREIAVVGHTECGMKNINGKDLQEKLRASRIQVDLNPLELERWLGKIDDERDNVLETVQQLRNSEWLPKEVQIYGLLLDIYTMRLEQVVGDHTL